MVTTLKASPVTGPLASHGEGPVWNASAGAVEWVDMFTGDMLSLSIETGETVRRPAASMLAAFRHRRRGGYVLATETGFRLTDAELADPVDVPAFEDPTLRMNDGGCDRSGRFYAGSMAYDTEPHRGALYRLDPNLTVTRVLSGVTISNGLAFPEDSDTAVYVDSGIQAIRRYNTDGDEWTLTGPVVEIESRLGTPDGLCLDREGGVWVALWGGSAVHRYSAEGAHTHTVPLPASQATSCALGGPAMDQLYITTSAFGIPDDEEPLAGSLFMVEADVPGFAAHTFAG